MQNFSPKHILYIPRNNIFEISVTKYIQNPVKFFCILIKFFFLFAKKVILFLSKLGQKWTKKFVISRKTYSISIV